MAVTALEILADVIELVERTGGYMSSRDQVTVARARTLLAISSEPVATTRVLCRTPHCPSRLEFSGDMAREQVELVARTMRWAVAGDVHVCPGCRKDVAWG